MARTTELFGCGWVFVSNSNVWQTPLNMSPSNSLAFFEGIEKPQERGGESGIN